MMRKKINRELLSNKTRIKENSWIAKLAAKKLHAGNMAIVIGNTIYLHNTSRHDFLQNEKWLKHELCHLRQFQHYGLVYFLAKYTWEYLKNGYHNNKFEAEAREAENL